MQHYLNFIGVTTMLSLVLLAGCRPNTSPESYKKTVLSAKTAIPFAVEMEELFGNGSHFITHYGFDDDTKIWNTQVFFGDKYDLGMQVDIKIDYSTNTVKLVGEPTFYLNEVIRVEKEPGGGVSTSFGGTSNQKEFGLKEWRKVYKSKGDFSTIGYQLSEEKILDFDVYSDGKLEPRIHVSLLD